jgi:hypothetical protein
MNPLAILSSATGALCVVLSAVFFLKSNSVQSLQADLQKSQQEVQTKQQDAQLQQQQLQMQQQRIEQGRQLAQQIGPQVLNDLGILARDNKNEKIRTLLEKHGVKVGEGGDLPK